jgi:hypothetical protein
LDDVAESLSWPPSKVSRIELGRLGVKPADLDALMEVCQIKDPAKRAVLHQISRHGRQRGWWQQYKDIIKPAYADLISLEDESASMRTYESTLIPGLLQTAAYARATIEALRMDCAPEEVDGLVTVRQARQSVLSRREPLELWAVIHEASLHPRVKSDPRMMKEQLQTLLDRQKLPNVSIQVLPLDAPPHVGMSGSFTMLGFPETADLDVVLVESLTSSLYVEDTAEVSRYGSAFERLRAAALPFDESAYLIEQLKDSIK